MLDKVHLPFVYISPDLGLTGDGAYLDKNEGHHLIRVLRKQKGEHIVAFNGQGVIREGVIVDERSPIKVDWIAEPEEYSRSAKIILLQGLTNEAGVMDDVIRSATELGISAFYPMLLDRSEKTRWASEKFSRKQKRWEQIALEACKQSKNPFLPTIHEITALNAIDEKFDVKIFCSVETGIPSLSEWLETTNIKEKLKASQICVGICIGPEGGLSPQEIQKFKSLDWTPLRLSHNVLRVVTAVNSALAILQQKLFLSAQ